MKVICDNCKKEFNCNLNVLWISDSGCGCCTNHTVFIDCPYCLFSHEIKREDQEV
jgi:hypothetical protein